MSAVFADWLLDRMISDTWKFNERQGVGTRWITYDFGFREDALEMAVEQIKPDVERWKTFGGGKMQFSHPQQMPAPVREIFDAMHSHEFVEALKALSGVPDLTADRAYKGGGIHATPRDGQLGIHVDFNRHPDGRYRRLNVFLFLGDGKDWHDEWGGHLELWDAAGKKCVQSIAPEFNRLVIFESTESSWHGHPHPLACPEGRFRLSLASYYFSNSRPADYRDRHSTIYLSNVD